MPELLPIQPVPPMQRGMDIIANRLPSSRALAGTDLALRLDDGGVLSLSFSAEEVRWRLEGAEGTSWSGENDYDAVEMRPGLFFVDYTAASDGAFSVVIDRELGRALVVQDRLAQSGGKTSLRLLVDPARLDGHDGPYEPIAETRELLGKRLFCEYSDEAALEHIYLNSGTLGWQWVLVEVPVLKREVGIEAASYWKVRDQLYLLASRGDEPLELTLLLDLEQGRNVGHLYGKSSSGSLFHQRCGAKIVFLGEFAYPADRQPG
jgi:hypothetical protein